MSETWYTLVVYICIMTITTISSMSKTVELEMCKTFAGLQDGLDGKYYHQVDDKLYHWNHTCTWRRNSQVLDSMVFLLSKEMCCKMRDVLWYIFSMMRICIDMVERSSWLKCMWSNLAWIVVDFWSMVAQTFYWAFFSFQRHVPIRKEDTVKVGKSINLIIYKNYIWYIQLVKNVNLSR